MKVRTFALVTVLVALFGYVTNLIRHYRITQKYWKQAERATLLKKPHPDTHKGIVFGTSFCPEMYYDKSKPDTHPMDSLRYAVEHLGIKEIRLGIRWDALEDERGNLSLSRYKHFIDYLCSQNASLCLNIGPIKALRWPEEHIPDHVLATLSEPVKYATITPDSELGTRALQYLERVCTLLTQELTPEQLRCITSIQPENEGFNRMGEQKLIASRAYLEQVLLIIKMFFPHQKILLNSAGRFQLRKIVHFIRYMQKKYPFFRGSFIVGYDYYFKTSFRDKFFLSRLLDSISFSIPFDIRPRTLQRAAERYTFDIEISEAQMEPWGEHKEPGNSFKDFNYMVLRCKNEILGKKHHLIRLWGIEQLAVKHLENTMTEEHHHIATTIQAITR